jgi:hypothetical protein
MLYALSGGVQLFLPSTPVPNLLCTVQQDIVAGSFKGFAMLRQAGLNHNDRLFTGWDGQPKARPMYVEVSFTASGN